MCIRDSVSDETSGASVGCLVYREDVKQSVLHPAQGALAQCRVDGSGRRLLIEGAVAEDNRVVDLETGAETPLPAPATDDASPDPTLLPVATTAQIPLTSAY